MAPVGTEVFTPPLSWPAYDGDQGVVRLLGYLLRSAWIVAWRRLRHGAKRPSWSFGMEVLVENMRAYMAWMATLDAGAQRAAAEKLVGRSAEQRLVHRTTQLIAGVPSVWFEPRTLDPDAPVILYVHGGGGVFGSAAQDAAFIARLAVCSRAKVAAVDYRLAPEHPCPAAVEDVTAVYRGLLASGQSAGDIAFFGLSAGAAIALASQTAARDLGLPAPRCTVLVSAHLDATCTAPTFAVNAAFDYGSRRAVEQWVGWYAGGRALTDPAVSPLFADLRRLPPLLLHVGDAELIRDDSVRFAERARAAGVEVRLRLWPDMIHGFPTFGDVTPAARAAIVETANFFKGGYRERTQKS